MEKAQNKKIKINYLWVIITLSFICVCTSLGLCSSGKTMYLTAITDALSIKRSLYSLTDTIRYGITTILNLFLGFFISKFGVRKLIILGFSCLIGFAYISSITNTIWGFYLASMLLGIGLSWTSTAMMSAVVNIWCKSNKGTITGIILSANGLGGAVAVQILSPIIFKPSNHPFGYEPFGYRNSYKIVALILAVVLILVILFFKDKPQNTEATNFTVQKNKKIRAVGWIGIKYEEVVKKPYYYLAMVCIFLTGMSLQGIENISTPHFYDLGFSKPFVANLTTLTCLILMGTKILTGYIYDKKGIKLTMNICFLCACFSLISLVLIQNTLLGKILAYISRISSVIALPLETVMLPLFASEMFGDKSFYKTLGTFTAVNTAGLALGAPFSNISFDLFGDYNLAFIILAIFIIFALIVMNICINKALQDKKLVLDSIKEQNQINS